MGSEMCIRDSPSFDPTSFQYLFPVVDITWDDVWTIQDGKCAVVDPARPAPVYSHSAVRPARGEGLVVDTGAVEDLTGNDFVRRHSADAQKHGYHEAWMTLDKPRRLAGVGDATKTCTHAVTLTCALQTGEKVAYQAPVIPGGPGGSPVPPLLGLKSMQKDFVFFDTVKGIMYMPPQELVDQIVWPPGTRRRYCEKTMSGHWVLPVSCWDVDKVVPPTPSSRL